jgi:hypothetical protein
VSEAEQLLLWRWSTIVQVTSLAMVAGFFAVMSRTNRRPELVWWTRAWSANLLAMVVTSAFWLIETHALDRVITGLYMGFKTAFALMLAQGAWMMTRPGTRLFTSRQLAIALAVYGLAAAALLSSVALVGIVQHTVVAAILMWLALVLWRSDADAVAWLATGITLRALLAVAEVVAYIIQWRSPFSMALAEWSAAADAFVSASSSFDMGVEWLVVLGSVLTVSERGRNALEASHHRLVLAQEDLRRLADRDPLTGATNRRALREIFNAVQDSGAMLLFFDLDGFKKINDDHGHAAGDGVLKLFVSSLRESFRPDDYIVRYGGDEFLVIAPGLDSGAARARVGT